MHIAAAGVSCHPRRVKPLIACAIMLCTAPPLHAEMYKWVDEKGVTNYSESPPAGKKASSAKVVEDRISVVATDPNFEKSADALRQREARRAELVDADYARRQALPPTKPVTYDIYDECPYGADCSGYGYYPGYGYYGGHRPVRRRPPHVAHHNVNVNSNSFGSAPGYKPARTIPSPLLGAPRAPAPLR